MRDEGKRIYSVRDLEVYRLAFRTAMEIYEFSKKFPQEEKYSLTDQIRRSSRAVCACLAEGWRKRRYKAMFVSKLLDASQEAAETQTWIEFAHECNYISRELFDDLDGKYEHIFAMLTSMERKADYFCKNYRPSDRRERSSVVQATNGSGRPSNTKGGI
jgi:four helix bundle protein